MNPFRYFTSHPRDPNLRKLYLFGESWVVVIRLFINHAIHAQQLQSGFNQQALEEVAKLGYANSAFEVDSDEGLAIVEEFYNADADNDAIVRSTGGDSSSSDGQWQSLEDELRRSVRKVS